jgi:hypothetical protein
MMSIRWRPERRREARRTDAHLVRFGLMRPHSRRSLAEHGRRATTGEVARRHCQGAPERPASPNRTKNRSASRPSARVKTTILIHGPSKKRGEGTSIPTTGGTALVLPVLRRPGESILRTQGFSQVSLWVLEKNVRGRRVYRTMGFPSDGATNELAFGEVLKATRYRERLSQVCALISQTCC